MKQAGLSAKIFILFLLANVLAVQAQEEHIKHGEEIQEFTRIFPEKAPKQEQETDLDTAKKITISSEKKVSKDHRFISVKNEFYKSIKLSLEYNDKVDEIYLNAYELLKDVIVPKNTKLNAKVYNIYGEFMGYIKQEDKKAKQLRISPFFLIESEPVIAKEELKEKLDTKPEIKPDLEAETKAEIKNPEPIISSSIARYIKIANIGEENIHINIFQPNGNPIGDGWTISNDIYVPQYLNFQAQPIDIDPESELEILNSSQKLIAKKKAKDLNIDQKGNYVWFINELPQP